MSEGPFSRDAGHLIWQTMVQISTEFQFTGTELEPEHYRKLRLTQFIYVQYSKVAHLAHVHR